MSSATLILIPTQRKAALVLSRALREVEQKCESGERDKNALIECGKRHIAKEPAARLDYLELVNADTLDPVAQATPGTMVAVAAYVGNTRLIDNLLLP